ncbi:hypothetical protein IG631_07419 [Alternaria alternata]|nr:hypothetical protein IG631_07419 [Alternaria alternata]
MLVRGGASGCEQGMETTMKCRGIELATLEASVRHVSEVMRRVMNSRGEVGPGNWADNWYTVVLLVISGG